MRRKPVNTQQSMLHSASSSTGLLFSPTSTQPNVLTRSTRIQSIQAEMTFRAIELLALPKNKVSYLLDIGCGSGLSGECLEDEGHFWVGVDISKDMLDVAINEREVEEGDLFLWDIGQGLTFRPGAFDGAIRCGGRLLGGLFYTCSQSQAHPNTNSEMLVYQSFNGSATQTSHHIIHTVVSCASSPPCIRPCPAEHELSFNFIPNHQTK